MQVLHWMCRASHGKFYSNAQWTFPLKFKVLIYLYGGLLKTLILAIIFLASCASHHNDPVPGIAAPLAITSEPTLEQVKKEKGSPKACHSIESYTYCQWDLNTMVFNNGKYTKTITPTKEAQSYDVTYSALKDEDSESRTFFLAPASKKINQKGLVWKKLYPYFLRSLSTNGFVLAPNPQDAQSIVKVSFGVKTTSSGKALRHLHYTAYDKEQNELWKIEVTSLGTSLDVKRIVPALTALVQSTLPKSPDSVQSLTISENSVQAVAFEDYVKSFR